jgi:hypothetical protein
MGATHFLMKRLFKVAAETALYVLAYTLIWASGALSRCSPQSRLGKRRKVRQSADAALPASIARIAR